MQPTTLDDDEFVIKVVLCGEPGAGKTSLALRYSHQAFCITEKPTIGVGMYVQSTQTKQRAYRFQIWDTSGQERFKGMLPTWFQGAMVLCFIYNVSSRASFDAIPIWLAKARWAPLPGPTAGAAEQQSWGCHQNPGAVIGVLIGTQVDRVTYREVDTDVAQDFAHRHNLLFAETSALTGQGIEECFGGLVCQRLDALSLPKPVLTYLPGTEAPVDDPLLVKKKKKKSMACCCRIV